MTDHDYRKRARRAKSVAATTADKADALIARIRSGELHPSRVEWAAWLGSPAAKVVFPNLAPYELNDYSNVDWVNYQDIHKVISEELTKNQLAKLVRYGWKLTGSSQDFDDWNTARGDASRVAALIDYLFGHPSSVRNRQIFSALLAKVGDLLLE